MLVTNCFDVGYFISGLFFDRLKVLTHVGLRGLAFAATFVSLPPATHTVVLALLIRVWCWPKMEEHVKVTNFFNFFRYDNNF